MKNIIILITAILFSTTSVNSEEHNKTLKSLMDADDCYVENKISPDTFACSIKKGFRNLYTKEDGSLNVLGKFFNAKSLADVTK